MRKIFAMLGKVTAYEKFQESPGFNNDFQNLKSLLKEENSDFLLEDINSILNESLEGIETIGKIVKGIRDFSQIDRNELENVNLNELMDQTLLMTKSQIKKICACEINFEENLPKIFCSPQQLSQVFINIIINAIEAIEKRDETETNFAADKGVIRISTGIFKDPNDSSNDKIQLIFADNGCGISPKNQTRIFDPFFTTKDIGQGTGLGMSIVYNIISKLNGKITIQSREGKGTEFFILLPIGN
jgi:signal transduction histidine kinase